MLPYVRHSPTGEGPRFDLTRLTDIERVMPGIGFDMVIQPFNGVLRPFENLG